nr:F-box domain containing protein [Pandoravirus aubagnensis]
MATHTVAAMLPPCNDPIVGLDALPEEIMSMITTALGIDDITALLVWSLTCHHYRALVMDQTLWRHLYRQRFGTPLLKRFLDEGKDWTWLYRARACAIKRTATGKSVGAQGDPTMGGGVYCGDLVDGRPCGYGALFTAVPHAKGGPDPAGTCDEGHWVDGTMRYGSRTLPGGAMYLGEWDDDGNYHGFGIKTHSDGRVHYRGQWDRGSACGYGVTCEPDPYTGEWNLGRPNGYGSATWRAVQGGTHDVDGTYRGAFQDGYANGYGVIVYANGDRYEGEWKRSVRDGYGVYTSHAAGLTYRGRWEDDVIRGRGIAHYSDGDSYDGEWDNGDWCGYGIYTSTAGWAIHAHFHRGAQHGYAMRTQKDGRVYRGHCVDGVPQGQGALRYPDGTVQEGEFRDGTMHRGQTTHADGSRYEGVRVGSGTHLKEEKDIPDDHHNKIADDNDLPPTGKWQGAVKCHGPLCSAEALCLACVWLGNTPTNH